MIDQKHCRQHRAKTVTTRQLVVLMIFAIILPGQLVAAKKFTPVAPKVSAKAWFLMDFTSGHIMASHNEDIPIQPASLTKMMTAYVVEQEIKAGNIALTDKVKISLKARKMDGSRMFLEAGSRVSVEKLLKGVIVQSGNDASIALAEHIAGSEESFVSLMNNYARMLGMHNTNFENATGWPHKRHRSTVRDLSTLAQAIIRDFPEHYKWYSIQSLTHNGITQPNRNTLLKFNKYVDGIKTGHTDSAGYCLVASATRDDMRLISVVVGTRSDRARSTESEKLLTFGFRFFETHKLYSAGQELTQTRIWKGAVEQLSLGIPDDVFITIPRGRYKDLEPKMIIEPQIIAPAFRGRRYGELDVQLDGQSLLKKDLVGLADIAEGGFWGGLVDDVQLLFE